MSEMIKKASTAAEALMREIERRMMALPDGWSLAVSDLTTSRSITTHGWSMDWQFQELAEGAKPAGAGRWTVYGPMTAELRQKAMELGLPRAHAPSPR